MKKKDIQLRKNIESEIVFTLSSELIEVLKNYKGKELRRQLNRIINIPPDLMEILETYETKDL